MALGHLPVEFLDREDHARLFFCDGLRNGDDFFAMGETIHQALEAILHVTLLSAGGAPIISRDFVNLSRSYLFMLFESVEFDRLHAPRLSAWRFKLFVMR